jgi:murein DD-endopeptidase MepM/ murein hydrolase activator NlpD
VKKRKQFLLVLLALTVGLLAMYLFKKGSPDQPKEPIAIQGEPKDSSPALPEISKEKREQEKEEQKPDEIIEEVAKSQPETGPKKRGEGYYVHPLEGPLRLSGTFGELRSNHFHAGLDIRTGGVEGKKVMSVADGYISRIKVSTRGYGKALYIQHPNGTTSVYGHLQKFSGAIQDAVIARQYQLKTFEMDWYVPVGKLKVSKGQVVAISGNTGGSAGPHLHFEIRDRRGKTVNPLLYGIKVQDNMEPRVLKCQLLEIDEDRHMKFGAYAGKTIIREGTMRVPEGRYGVAADWIDYFVDKGSRLGINYAELRVDGKVVFTHTLEDFAFDQGRYINRHIDFWRYKQEGRRYVKMFKDQGNTLHIYKGSGTLRVKDGDHKKIEIRIRDYAGKSDKFRFELVGDKTASKLNQGGGQVNGTLCKPGKSNWVGSNNASVSIPKWALYTPTYINVSQTPATGKAVSPMVRINNAEVPLHKSATIKIKIPEDENVRKFKNRLVMMSYDPKSRSSSYEGGKLSGEYVQETSKNLGIFYLAIDSVPPKVTLLSGSRNLRIKVEDLTSGIKSYSCTVLGKWVLLEYDPKRNLLTGTVPSSIESGSHALQLVVSDGAGNTFKYAKTITF